MHSKLVRYIPPQIFICFLLLGYIRSSHLLCLPKIQWETDQILWKEIKFWTYNNRDEFFRALWNWLWSLIYSFHLLATWKGRLATKTFPSFVPSESKVKFLITLSGNQKIVCLNMFYLHFKDYLVNCSLKFNRQGYCKIIIIIFVT